MKITNYTNARKNFASIIEEIHETKEPIIITKGDDEAVAMISMDHFEDYLKNQIKKELKNEKKKIRKKRNKDC